MARSDHSRGASDAARQRQNNLLLLLASLVGSACDDGSHHSGRELDPRAGELLIPSADSWVARGTIFTQGGAGSWDTHLFGGFTASAVLRDGTLFLYYQGANGFDEREGTVTFRAVGLATSVDGSTFAKHAQSPVLTWTPNDYLEEGVGSAAALLMPDGRMGIYYGALDYIGRSSVTADARLATSTDGISFQDVGPVLRHSDGALWGAGDEIFPVVALQHRGRWIVYYIPNGTPQRALLGVAFGPGPTELTSSAEVLASGSSVPAWGPGAAAILGPDRYAIFVNADADRHADGPHIDAYAMDPAEPHVLEGPRSVLTLPDMSRGTVVFDSDTDTWLLLHRNAEASEYRVRASRALREPW